MIVKEALNVASLQQPQSSEMVTLASNVTHLLCEKESIFDFLKKATLNVRS